MRRMLRKKAHFMMEKAGLRRVNKTRYNGRGMVFPSFFSKNWRKYAQSIAPKNRRKQAGGVA